MDDYQIELAQRRREALMEGIARPLNPDDPEWVEAAERLVSRGVGTYQQLADVLDIPFPQAKGLLEAVRERWRNSEPSTLATERREELYQRVRAVADIALTSALGLDERSSNRHRYLKVALDAYDRGAALAGVKDHKEVEVKIELKPPSPKEVLAGFGLGDLRALGAASAAALAGMAEEPAVDAEFVPAEPAAAPGEQAAKPDAPAAAKPDT